MLVGRTAECERLEKLLDDGRGGSSRVLILRGEPGVGKSALLQYAADKAGLMTVLTARGIESEAEIPFSGLFELLRAALPMLSRIPEPQATALRGALTLGPPAPTNRFAIGVATLSLLAAQAEEAPLLVLVDDAHWVDASSADALVFATRRLLAEPITVLLAVRANESSPFDAAGLPALDVVGLDREAARTLLVQQAGRAISPEVCDWLYRSTAGNPLALIELAAGAPGLGIEPFDRPLTVETRVEHAFARQIERLSDAARHALVVAAASGSGDLEPITRALMSVGVSPTVLEEAESAGVVRINDGSVEFRHPLMRSAAYHTALPTERRAAHRALADALGAARHADLRAWHLASASLGPSDEISAALEEAGRRAQERSAYAAAASAFERAAQLTSGEEARARRLLAAADAAWLAGATGRASGLVEGARERAQEPRLRAEIDHLRGRVAMRQGPVIISHDILVSAAAEVVGVDPAKACLLMAEAADALVFAGAAPLMLETARRARDLATVVGTNDAAFFTSMALGQALILNGQGEAGAQLVRRALAIMEASETLQRDPRLVSWAGRGRLFLREGASGTELIHRAVALAREQGAMGMLAVALNQLALDSAVSDRWAEAHAQFAEAIRLARETGQTNDLCSDLAGLARLEARQGRAEECRAHAAEAFELAERLGLGQFRIWVYLALGTLELGLGHPEEVIRQAGAATAVLQELRFQDPDVSPTPELVEAYLRLGRAGDAWRVAGDFVRLAEDKSLPWSLARAARCQGLLSNEESYERHFADAIHYHDSTSDSFERGRTHLCYGERLRRARRRVQARGELRRAFQIFDRLGAVPWAERARVELLATGETARRRDARTLDHLTPQEFQIAQLLGVGATTREAAAKLFLSPKTIEYHLRTVYDKLGVRTRSALADVFGDQSQSASSEVQR